MCRWSNPYCTSVTSFASYAIFRNSAQEKLLWRIISKKDDSWRVIIFIRTMKLWRVLIKGEHFLEKVFLFQKLLKHLFHSFFITETHFIFSSLSLFLSFFLSFFLLFLSFFYFFLSLSICYFSSSLINECDHSTIADIVIYDRGGKPTNPLSGAVLKNNTTKRMMKIQKTVLSNWKYFSSRDELKGEVDNYCQDPDNYDTSKYGYVMRVWFATYTCNFVYSFWLIHNFIII